MITFQNYKLLVSIDNSLGSKGFSELISLCMKKGIKIAPVIRGKELNVTLKHLLYQKLSLSVY